MEQLFQTQWRSQSDYKTQPGVEGRQSNNFLMILRLVLVVTFMKLIMFVVVYFVIWIRAGYCCFTTRTYVCKSCNSGDLFNKSWCFNFLGPDFYALKICHYRENQFLLGPGSEIELVVL